jgi:predicted TIM-barrel fold metal-dependent hydrolase
MTRDHSAGEHHSHAHVEDAGHADGTKSCCGPSRRGFLKTAALVTGGALIPGSLLAQAPTPATRKRIDTHFHFYPPGVGSELGSGISKRWSPKIAMDEMDKNGIVSAVLSVSSAPEDWWRLDVQQLRGKVRALNDYAAKMVHEQPKRFGQFAFLSMADVDGTLKEIEYAFDTLKADGVGLPTSYGDKWPGDPKFAPIFDELNRRKAVVYFHPNAPFCCGRDLVPHVAVSWAEYPHDTTRAILNMLFSGTFVKHRDIKFLFSHGGGTIPMLAGRIDWLSKGVKNRKQVAPDGIEAEFRRLHYDTASAFYPSSMAAFLKVIPPSQLVYGSDYPYVTEAATIEGLMQAGLSDADLKAVEMDNALKLVPRLKA